MKAISIQQPWAWSILAGHKRYENRSWKTSYRGPLLIHTGKSKKSLPAGIKLHRQCGYELPKQLTYGAVLGRVDLVDCLPIARIDDPFAVGPWCFVLENPVTLEYPLYCPGQLFLYDIEKLLQSDPRKLKAMRALWERRSR